MFSWSSVRSIMPKRLSWRCGIQIFSRLARLPLRCREAIFATLGLCAFYSMRKRRRIVATNLAWCFPDMALRDRRALARRHGCAMGLGVMDTLRTWSLSEKDCKQIWHLSAEDRDRLRQLKDSDRGVLFVGAHFIGMEIMLRFLSVMMPVGVVQRRVGVPALHDIIHGQRSRFVSPIVYKGESLRTVAKVLRQGGAMGVLTDQDMGLHMGVFAPFMGLSVATITLASRLHRLTNCSVVYLQALRGSDGKYRMTIRVLDDVFAQDDLVAHAAAINACIEEGVRQAPSQYYWCHRRFKTQPPDSPYRYPR